MMFPDIIGQMPPLEFSETELDQPVSVNEIGGVATVRELIAEKASSKIRELFDIAEATIGVRVRPVKQLDRNELKIVAIALLESSDPKKRVASLGGGDYSTGELVGEVERGTPMGQKIIRGVRLNGILVESAIDAGKIRPRLHTLGR
jgi:hypothetical protein